MRSLPTSIAKLFINLFYTHFDPIPGLWNILKGYFSSVALYQLKRNPLHARIKPHQQRRLSHLPRLYRCAAALKVHHDFINPDETSRSHCTMPSHAATLPSRAHPSIQSRCDRGAFKIPQCKPLAHDRTSKKRRPPQSKKRHRKKPKRYTPQTIITNRCGSPHPKPTKPNIAHTIYTRKHKHTERLNACVHYVWATFRLLISDFVDQRHTSL